MKLTRSIVIFPQFGEQLSLIQDIRQQYDPLASKIAPHITVVFPFESEISSDVLYQHLKSCLNKFESFDLCLRGIIQEEDYLFLNLVEGQEQIRKIHNALYSGILQQFLSEKYYYKPHITVGRLSDTSIMQAALSKLNSFDYEFRTQVNKVTTEIILADSSSKTDFAIALT